MKVPRTRRRYCPYCKKHTIHKINLAAASKQRGSLKKGSITRAHKRGRGKGYGNLGKWGSKPAVTKWKRKTKATKKTNITYTCSVCGKTSLQKKGKRTSKAVFSEEKK